MLGNILDAWGIESIICYIVNVILIEVLVKFLQDVSCVHLVQYLYIFRPHIEWVSTLIEVFTDR